MPEPRPESQLSTPAARAAMIAAQGLHRTSASELVPALEKTGFLRTLGGVDAYVAGRCRVPGLSREAAERRELLEKLGRFLTEEVGHGRSFSLDTEESLRTRVAEIRRLGY